ncbi:MAG: hypothetical protein M3Q19_10700 [Pseudomonadota bacterium]|nr:hypothetical protein [Pseudomonadota bacterium]
MNNDSEPLRVDTTPDADLKIDADGEFKVPTYDIAPEDKHIADRILAMDPLRDIPSPFRGFESIKQPALTLSSLPPPMQQAVERKLAMVPASKRAESEREFVRAALEDNSRNVRLRAGVGEGALPFHKTAAELEANHRALSRQFDSISEQLAEVERYDMRVNPATGQREPVPVLAVNGSARLALVRQQEQLNYRMERLEKEEGQRQLQKALMESVELIKRREAQLAEETEVQAGAESKVREDRIAKRVAARARMINPDVT